MLIKIFFNLFYLYFETNTPLININVWKLTSKGNSSMLVLETFSLNWKYANSWHFLKLSLTEDLISSKEYAF